MKELSKSDKRAEWLAFGLFIVLYILISLFHEPMYDEAQAWLIARDASWTELLFDIPHYEGHPPFWHLVLALFAKLGVPFEVGLRIPGALFCITAVGVLLFRSPFPKVVKCLLPFTYYIFFRYSVVVRPYCMTMLGLFLVASTYKEKSTKPFRFMASLLLLCASSAYGMAFAAGICIVWIIEIFTRIKENYIKQILALFVLLVCNVGQLLLMMPKEDTNAVVAYSISTILYGLIYMFVLGPADSMFLDTGMDARLQNYAEGIVTGGTTSVINILIGLITVGFLLYYAKKYRKMLLFIIPYSLFALFAAAVYFWYHHIGLIHLYLIFVFWCALADNDKAIVKRIYEDSNGTKEESTRLNDIKEESTGLNSTKEKSTDLGRIKDKYAGLTDKLPKVALIICLGMSLAWSIFCSGTDLLKTTWYTTDLAWAIKEVGADQGNCGLQWDITFVGPFEEMTDYEDASKYYHTASVTQFFDCLAYYDENIFYNHNGGNKEISYNQQYLPDAAGQSLIMEANAEYGYPEFFIGHVFVLDALPIDEEMPNYAPVYRFEVYKPDKFIIDYNDRYIYAREDIYQQRSDWPIKEQLMVK